MNNIGMIGLSVMGSNLAMNMADKGFAVAAFDFYNEYTKKFRESNAKNYENITAYDTLEEFIASLEKPRKIWMMIRAGSPVDETIEKLVPLLEEGDLIIDGGNSHFPDTTRRCEYLKEKGLLYIGTGVSGGEEGALRGPSLMPGGSKDAWPLVKDIFQKICAHTEDGSPCADWVGENGAGHFVKMVHNGIEYGDMELICEAYQMLRDSYSNEDMSQLFTEWNKGELNSYLIEITSEILKTKDETGYVVDAILDKAGQKGTGKWTAIAALDEGQPLTLISEAVFARCLSSLKEERVNASKAYGKEMEKGNVDAAFAEEIRKALYVSKIISYAQGYSLMRSAAKTYDWKLNYGGIALMWRGGCIIRSQFLGKIKEAFDKNYELENLILDDYFKEIVEKYIPSLRKVVVYAIEHGISVPAFSSALSYFDGYTTEKMPMNLMQAQRDYFGAHTYQRIDQEGTFHTDWTNLGNGISSTTYNV
ncbi:MAG: decarboxylating NADP(+)-dependent phosphogluconate dehydrogenase [Solobacterium sp.]|nr:decarboxylating NADP(+)-dependent phosphogluconate dehydrogenase [Solobacterium sp.]